MMAYYSIGIYLFTQLFIHFLINCVPIICQALEWAVK